LGVTQMRLGLLLGARASFNRASEAFANSAGSAPASLGHNRNALEGHESYAQSSGRDPTTMYSEYQSSPHEEEDEADTDPQGEINEMKEEKESSLSSNRVSTGASVPTRQAIELVESGDVLGALPLFEAATQQDPRDPGYWENLGVTQMRLGLLTLARTSLDKARSLNSVDTVSALENNYAALEEHEGYADSIDHDPSTMYDEFVSEAKAREEEEAETAAIRFTEGLCDDGFDVVEVSVGDRVEVRDSGGAWDQGVVESVDSKTGRPSVAKDGWPISYEWDECREEQ